jgi:SAM-dependent methyltransferase
MSNDALNTAVQDLLPAVEAMAAIGAGIRVAKEGLQINPRVRDAMQEVIRAVDPALLEGAADDQKAMALSAIRAAFRFATDMLDDPARSPGWSFADTTMIQSQGQRSRRVVATVDEFAATRPDLKRSLQSPGAFLDVGCGAGWLSIEAAQCWPALRTVGIDPWDKALNLARSNVAAVGLSGRIEFRQQCVEDLTDLNEFSLLWLPAPFLAPDVIPLALARARAALRPGGWIVVGLFGAPPDPLRMALAALRTVRSGGHPWKTSEIEALLRDCGFAQIEASLSETLIWFVVAQKV